MQYCCCGCSEFRCIKFVIKADQSVVELILTHWGSLSLCSLIKCQCECLVNQDLINSFLLVWTKTTKLQPLVICIMLCHLSVNHHGTKPSYSISLKYIMVINRNIYSEQQAASLRHYTTLAVLFTLCGQIRALTQEKLMSFPCNSIIFFMPLYVRSSRKKKKKRQERRRISEHVFFIRGFYYLGDFQGGLTLHNNFRPWVGLKEKIFNPSVKLREGEVQNTRLSCFELNHCDTTGSFLLINAIFNWNLNLSLWELSVMPQTCDTSAVLKSLRN